MSIEQDIWFNLVNKLKQDAALLAYLGSAERIYEGYQVKILNRQLDIPCLFVEPIGIEEEWVAFPRQKRMNFGVEIRIKIEAKEKYVLEILKLSELVKNAIEKDLSLNGKALRIDSSTLELKELSEVNDIHIRDAVLNFKIMSIYFTAGER